MRRMRPLCAELWDVVRMSQNSKALSFCILTSFLYFCWGGTKGGGAPTMDGLRAPPSCVPSWEKSVGSPLIVVSVYTLYIDENVRSYNVENTRASLVVVVVGAEADASKQVAEQSLEGSEHCVIWFAVVVV